MILEANRRRAERVRLPMPRAARLGGFNVVLSDVSVVGAGIQHHVQIPREIELPLSFRWEKQDLDLHCRLVRSRLELFTRGETSLRVYHSGLVFVDLPETRSRVRSAIASRVASALDRQKADARGVAFARRRPSDSSGSLNLNSLFPLIGDAGRAYICCTYERGIWRREIVQSPEQPQHGFTVSADETAEEIEMLCRTFSGADEEERRLIRIFAHLSLAEPSDIARDVFMP
jgi:hypothetical protein